MGVLCGSCVSLLALRKGTLGSNRGPGGGPWVVLGATCRVVPFLGRSRSGFRDFPGNSGWPFGTILVPFWVHFSIQNGDENLIDFFVDFVSILGPFLVHFFMLFWS